MKITCTRSIDQCLCFGGQYRSDSITQGDPAECQTDRHGRKDDADSDRHGSRGYRLDLDEDVEIETEGTALLPVQRTMAILRESNDEISSTLETDDSGVRILGAAASSSCRETIRTSFRTSRIRGGQVPRRFRRDCFARWFAHGLRHRCGNAVASHSAACCWRWRRRG